MYEHEALEFSRQRLRAADKNNLYFMAAPMATDTPDSLDMALTNNALDLANCFQQELTCWTYNYQNIWGKVSQIKASDLDIRFKIMPPENRWKSWEESRGRAPKLGSRKVEVYVEFYLPRREEPLKVHVIDVCTFGILVNAGERKTVYKMVDGVINTEAVAKKSIQEILTMFMDRMHNEVSTAVFSRERKRVYVRHGVNKLVARSLISPSVKLYTVTVPIPIERIDSALPAIKNFLHELNIPID